MKVRIDGETRDSLSDLSMISCHLTKCCHHSEQRDQRCNESFYIMYSLKKTSYSFISLIMQIHIFFTHIVGPWV